MSEVQALPSETPQECLSKRRRAVVVGGVLGGALLLLLVLFWSRQQIVSQLALVDGMVYTVAPEVSGPLRDLVVEEGSRVQQGQVVGHMEVPRVPEPMQAATREVTGLRPPTREEVEQRLRGARAAEEDAMARLSVVRHEEEAAQKHVEDAVLAHAREALRMRSIAASGGLHSSEYRIAQEAEEKARKRMEKIKEDFERTSRVRAAMSQEVNRIRAEVQEAKRLASRNRYQSPSVQSRPATQSPMAPLQDAVLAPVDGTVIKISAHPGEEVRAGDPLLLVIPDGKERSLWVKAWFPVTAQKQLAAGMPCAVEREIDKKTFAGAIEEISSPEPLPKGQGQEGLDFLPVRVRLTDPSGLVPGDRVRCTITLGLL